MGWGNDCIDFDTGEQTMQFWPHFLYHHLWLFASQCCTHISSWEEDYFSPSNEHHSDLIGLAHCNLGDWIRSFIPIIKIGLLGTDFASYLATCDIRACST